MAERYFTNFAAGVPTDYHMDKDRVIDIRDERWAHPALLDAGMPWDMSEFTKASSIVTCPSLPLEDRLAVLKQVNEASATMFAPAPEEALCDISEYEVPGCPEEPDTKVKVLVYRPKSLGDTKSRGFFDVLGGGLTSSEPGLCPLANLAIRFNATLVTCVYRTAFEAPYPAAINDNHAAYAWMLENADMLGIDPQNVVLSGYSSGGHLALALGFRLKRYGIRPKGIVVGCPQTDDRQRDGETSIYSAMWDTNLQHNALVQWLGNDFGSTYVSPEALANHATVEDCKGYPPTFIHTAELDPDRHNSRILYGKLLEARVFTEFHCWAGVQHVCAAWNDVAQTGEGNDLSKRIKVVFDGNVEDCFNYDLSRDWAFGE